MKTKWNRKYMDEHAASGWLTAILRSYNRETGVKWVASTNEDSMKETKVNTDRNAAKKLAAQARRDGVPDAYPALLIRYAAVLNMVDDDKADVMLPNGDVVRIPVGIVADIVNETTNENFQLDDMIIADLIATIGEGYKFTKEG